MKLAGIELPPVLRDAALQCRTHVLAAAGFSFFINLLYLAPAIYMLQVYDRVVPTGGLATLLFITLILAFALITLSALDAVRLRLLVRAGMRLDMVLAPVIMERSVIGGPKGAQAMRDFETVRTTFASPVTAALMDLPWMPVFIIVAFLLHFWIGVLALIASAVVVALAWANQRSTRARTEAATQTMSAVQAWTQQAAFQNEAVRALGMKQAVVTRGLGARSTAAATLASAQFSGSRYTAASRFFRLFIQSAALGLGAWLAVEGKISIGAIIAASIIVGRALQPVDAIIAGWASLTGARGALRRLSETMAEMPEERSRTRLPAPEGRLSLNQVGFRAANGQPVLFGVTLDVSPGEVLAVVGPSGSGKTSLLKVMVGAAAPTVGAVRIDGAQFDDWDQDELGQHIGYLPQQPSLLEGTIRDNICRFSQGDPEAMDSEVVAASNLARVHEMILRLPGGYNTQLGPMGAGLSAGQAQRVALARALYGNPAILALDEPNSALDAEGDKALSEAVKEMRARGSAIVIAAHRKSTLEYADRVLVLDAGRPRLLGETAKVLAQLGTVTTKSESAA